MNYFQPTVAAIAIVILLVVLLSLAVALILVIFGKLKVDARTQRYLFGIFGGSTIFLILGIGGSSNSDVNKITERINSLFEETKIITLYMQIPSSSEVYLEEYEKIKKALTGEKFIVTSPDNVRTTISENEIRYCNEDNKADAENLQKIISNKASINFQPTIIACPEPKKYMDILEVWISGNK